MNYRTYDNYNFSDSKIIKKFPEDWEICKLKFILDKITDGAHTSVELVNEGFPYVTVTDIDENKEIVDIANSKRISKDDYETLVRNGCKPSIGDVLFSQIGTVGLVVPVTDYDDYVLLSSLAILTPSTKVNTRWLIHYLRSFSIKKQWKSLLAGGAVKRITLNHIANFLVLLPSISEQQQIANYLDKQTAKIDATIEKNEELIELLEEKRVALINQVVTKGLNPDVPMKDSGVEWIGEIPEHWECRKINTLSSVSRGASPRPIDDSIYFDEDGEYSWVRISDVTSSNKYLEKTTEKLSTLGKSLSVPIEPGNIFVSIAATVGKPIIANIKCCIHDGFVYFKNLNLNDEYLFYIFAGGEPYKGLGKLGTQLNLNTETIGRIHIPVPPKDEQKDIINYLDYEIEKVDKTINKVQENIELLNEYKTSLIHHVVTGKIDVRGEEI